jgi:hypothetical protein
VRKAEEIVPDAEHSMERLRELAQKIIAVPKSELEKRLAAYDRRKRKSRAKKT